MPVPSGPRNRDQLERVVAGSDALIEFPSNAPVANSNTRDRRNMVSTRAIEPKWRISTIERLPHRTTDGTMIWA
jgi:hypothetical protein